ncbi:MAG: von Willebrand factor type A domain-containing protein [Halopseudomonas sp.]
MNHTTFSPRPLTLAIATALLFGCSTEQTPLATVEPQTAAKSQVFKDEQQQLKKTDNMERREQERSLRLTQPTLSDADQLATASTSSAPNQIKQPAPQPQQNRKRTDDQRLAEYKAKASSLLSRDHNRIASAESIAPPIPAPSTPLTYSEPPTSNERFAAFTDNAVKRVADKPLSTFGIDVDTASYAIARQDLNSGRLPSAQSARVEEWLNYFQYSYPTPTAEQQPFSITTEVGPSPWADNKQLLLVGLKGYDVAKADLPPLNLTFLIDVSGSMHAQNKLPLAKTALKMLTQQLRPQDRVSIVVYAGAAGLVLDSASGSDKARITHALEQLRSGGSTAGGAGIQLAYRTAQKNHSDDAISRVILLSDGDMNVGTTSTEALKTMVAKQRSSGVSLSVLTFGRGNIRDELMNSLAEIGNGNAGYIDSAHEARKYLVDEMSGSLMTIAKDVKTQIEFNGELVSEYRLLGYETRHLENHEFDDDRKDAGEIGAGHAVTALYELTLKGSGAESIPPLRYRNTVSQNAETDMPIEPIPSQELAYLKLRYKQPNGDQSTLISQPIYRSQIRSSLSESSDNFRWAAAVAGAAQKARSNAHIGDWGYSNSIDLAKQAIGADAMGYRAEFIQMLRMATSLDQPQQLSRYQSQRTGQSWSSRQ